MALRKRFVGCGLTLGLALGVQTLEASAQTEITLAAVPSESDAIEEFNDRQRSASAGTQDWDSLLARLDADAWSTRQQAHDALVRLGPDILPRLRDLVRETSSEEVRARVEAAIRQIEATRATGTSVITMRVRGAAPEDVFAELARQGNTEFRISPANLWQTKAWPRVDLDIERQPFWAAMREICEKVGVNPRSGMNDREMEIVDRSSAACGRTWGEAPSVIVGPFMVAVMGINRSHYVDLQQPQAVKRNAGVQLLVFAEPKLRVLQGTYSARLEEALDASGNSMITPGLQQDGMQPNQGWVMNLSCGLTPQEGSDRISRLRGTGRFLVQTRSETARIDHVLSCSEVSRSVAGKRFTLKEVRRSGDTYIASVTLFRSGWSMHEWSMMHPYPQFRMLDGAGRAMQRVHTSGHGGGHEQSEVTLHFQRDPSAGDSGAADPTALLWEVATETREVVVPFEFRDLPLP